MRPSKRLAHRVIAGRAFILEPGDNVLHSLNPAASRIWELLGERRDAEQIARTLCAEFSVDLETARRDCAAFLGRLKAMRLVEE